MYCMYTLRKTKFEATERGYVCVGDGPKCWNISIFFMLVGEACMYHPSMG